jgi:TetR/AcrR family transcriptional regulator, repressor for uid operon
MDQTPPDRHSLIPARILDAAQRAFARSGLHQATMAEVAREAGMTAGNLYRYYANKNAIIAAIAEQDRQELATDFAALNAAGSTLDGLIELGRKHLVREPAFRMAMTLELWAEAARNPGVRSICTVFEETLIKHMGEFIIQAKLRGELQEGSDPAMIVPVLMMMSHGYIQFRATHPNDDPEPMGELMFGAIRTMMQSGPASEQPLSANPASIPAAIASASSVQNTLPTGSSS